MSTKEIAKAYATALGFNAVSLNEVIKWSDSVIVATDDPGISFIELSLCNKASDAVTQLNTISVGAEEKLFQGYLFGLLYKGLESKRSSYEDISKYLYFLAIEDDDLEIYDEAMHYWYAIDLADIGSIGDPVEVRNKFLNLLQENMIEIAIPNKVMQN